MKQLLILSGKGGTGKTTITSAFIKLANNKVFADCDVDAPNLHLLMNNLDKGKTSDFYGMSKADINTDKCIECGLCQKNCHFDAIRKDDKYKVDPYSCEGCGVCERICPVDAIELKPDIAGELKLYTEDNIFSTAELKMGSGTSGKLVTEVKNQLKIPEVEEELAIIDGSPGIGCPVIASITGVDMVLVVAEPSISGINDMKRIIKTSQRFGTKTAVCINKYDINDKNSKKIQMFCEENKIPFVGKVPFDTKAIEAVNKGKTIVDVKCESGEASIKVFNNTIKILNEN
ncbi:ATP-binding protein [Clostridium sp. D2Q-11]|uniref:ATP-binding protein n=1 Tax=Anaeromonas frigoriresistens TaxID=2683708 RepID=A0A942UYR6_9FIRM|nr:ATP-binding protein [Anaeromonas frigoriresistens]MBS4538786.1 ATP-binding protein [Anaeromonas frigoriresistens]